MKNTKCQLVIMEDQQKRLSRVDAKTNWKAEPGQIIARGLGQSKSIFLFLPFKSNLVVFCLTCRFYWFYLIHLTDQITNYRTWAFDRNSRQGTYVYIRFRFIIIVVVAVVVIKIQLRTIQSMRSNNGYVVPAADVIFIHYPFLYVFSSITKKTAQP